MLRKNGLIALWILVALILLFPANAQALSVGSFPYTKEKTVNASEVAKFTLGLFNLDENPAKVRIEVETELKVEYPEGNEILLNPEEGSGRWFYLGDGKYVGSKSLSFVVYAPNLTYNLTYPIKVKVTSFPAGSLMASDISQSVSQVTQYFFKLNVIGNETLFSSEETENMGEKSSLANKENLKRFRKIVVERVPQQEKLKTQPYLPTGFAVNVDIASLAIAIFTIPLVVIILLRGRY